ncbi:YraN family protein [Candidatus Dojkabacteria bacterium]|uniref:UPF0102 protein KC640_03175 n=1 Tax=Candidatus Dojkabacteria bacterium TaxID=2099670 RepID=A0A955I6I5_9BACT|nr:YraN family protein [Candidatus Dojkabacteria bacterium]
MHTRAKGDRSEDFAASYLRDLGYGILQRNFHAGVSEIDIIAKDGRETVFVEVKSVFAGSDIDISETLTQSKLARLRKGVNMWLLGHPETSAEEIRIDFVGIVLAPNGQLAKVEHFKSI